MKRFDHSGMMIFPNPERNKRTAKPIELIVVKECFCPEGHNLVSDQAVFDGFNGIVLKVKNGKQEGLVALNPVYGLKHRISIGIRPRKDELPEVLCPECGKALPVYSTCACGGDLIALFLDKKQDFTNSILICNRIGCNNAQIRFQNEVINYDDSGNAVFKES
ncbi:MAG: hypothetical protein V1775_15685 [Bacteroidota bacterium]